MDETKNVMIEIWKDILNYNGCYAISNLGRVKSLARKQVTKDRIIKCVINSRGYLRVNLYKNSIRSSNSVHQLVSVAFLNHVADGMNLVVNHIDFDKTNNNINNLEIVTSRVNSNRKHLKSKSEYTGVSWYKDRCKWTSRIVINKRKVHLGSFTTEIDASNVYQKALLNLNRYNGNNSEFRTYLNSL